MLMKGTLLSNKKKKSQRESVLYINKQYFTLNSSIVLLLVFSRGFLSIFLWKSASLCMGKDHR